MATAGSGDGNHATWPLSAVVVGGSSGMGKAAARAVLDKGGRVVLCSRSREKLQAAAAVLASGAAAPLRTGAITLAVLDNTDEAQVRDFFAGLQAGLPVPGQCDLDPCSPTAKAPLAPGGFDALIVTALGRAVHGSFLEVDTAKARDLMDGKLWGPWYCAKYGAPRLVDGGAIVFVSGILCRRPGQNCAPLTAANGAVEALTRAVALELGPRLRVNCLSPGFVDTERFDHLPPEKKRRMLEATADSLPLKQVGEPRDLGDALVFLATSRFTTGAVLDVDGGHQIRQYAMPNDAYFDRRAQQERLADAEAALAERTAELEQLKAQLRKGS